MTSDERRFARKVVAAIVAVHLVGWAGIWIMGGDDEAHGRAYVPAGRSAVETGADTPPAAATGGGVGGGQRPATVSAAEPVSAPTVNIPEVRS